MKAGRFCFSWEMNGTVANSKFLQTAKIPFNVCFFMLACLFNNK